MSENKLSKLYDAYYYEHSCGRPYHRDESWLTFFTSIANQIVSRIQPKTVLDAGCALGFLVEGLRNQEVEAFGIDISEYAIQNVHPDIKSFCWRGSLIDPLPQKYDLIISIEVLEHMSQREAEESIENLCKSTNDILFSSTPFDYKEATHFNVQPPEYWVEMFALQGFFRDVEFDASFITPWAVRFQRKELPVHRLARDYERRFWMLWKENTDLRELNVQTRNELSENEQNLISLKNQIEESDHNINELNTQISQQLQDFQIRYVSQERNFQTKIEEKDREIQSLQISQTYLNEILNTRGWIFLQGIQRIRLILVPRFSRRERFFYFIWHVLGSWKQEKIVTSEKPSQNATDQKVKSSTAIIQDKPRISTEILQDVDFFSRNPILTHQPSADIIICVHNAMEDVRRCLESVIRYTSAPYRLILVDDGSNLETQNYLEDIAQSQGAVLLRNEGALGYTRAANQGLRLSSADFVILLNSDSIVTPNWLGRMIDCAQSDSVIGIVGPLSNTASWQSTPEIFNEEGDWAENQLPSGMTAADLAKLVAKYSNRLYPRIPFLNGFCLIIKRDLIEQLGYFDEENFGDGFGEENDYCMRAQKSSWELAVADDVYIFHAQSRSYSHESRKQLAGRADKILSDKYGQQMISDGVLACKYDRVLHGIRARMQSMFVREHSIHAGLENWEGKRILFLLPIGEPSGGGYVVLQEAKAMQRMGVDVRILNMKGLQPIFEYYHPDCEIPVLYIDEPLQVKGVMQNYDAVIGTLYSSIEWMTHNSSFNMITRRGYYIQDFEPDFFLPGSKEYQNAIASYTRFSDLIRITKTEWNYGIIQEKLGVDSHIVGPSIDIDLFRPRRRKDPDWPERPLRIAAMIRPNTPRRNPAMTMRILHEFHYQRGPSVELILFGCQSNDPGFLELSPDFPWRQVGVLNRPQIASLFNEVDIFVDFSIFQAMGLTALEAMACGVAVIVPEQGGVRSFAHHEQNSLLVNTNSEQACLEALNRLSLNANLRSNIQRQATIDVCQYPPETAAFKILKALFS